MKIQIKFDKPYWQNHSTMKIKTDDCHLFSDMVDNMQRKSFISQYSVGSTRQAALRRMYSKYKTVEEILYF